MNKLYAVPPNSYIRIGKKEDNTTQHPPAHREFEEQEVLFFDHLDGMYSFCRDKDGQVVHLAAYQEVEIVEDPKWKED